MQDQSLTELHNLTAHGLIEKLNFYNNLLNQAEKIAKLGHWQWNILENEIIWSKNLYRIFGIKKGKQPMDFQLFTNLIHEEDRNNVNATIQKALVTNYFNEFYHRIVLPGGEIRILHARGEVIVNKKNVPVRMVGTSQDVTEIKLAEQELQIKASELENKNAELKKFAYVASHDLQEPLRKLMVFCSLLENNYKSMLDEKGKEYILKIVNSSLKMRNLINNILEVSNVSENIVIGNVDLNVVLSSVVTDLETTIENTGARITCDTLPIIEGNETQMYQVFQNLLSNAIKFCKRNQSPAIDISSTVTKSKKTQLPGQHDIEQDSFLNDPLNCVITVKDNGTGFDEKKSEKIFSLFQSLHSRTEYKGNGIGLSIVKKIIEAHHGTIKVKSIEGEGSSFIITIPLKQKIKTMA